MCGFFFPLINVSYLNTFGWVALFSPNCAQFRRWIANGAGKRRHIANTQTRAQVTGKQKIKKEV